MDIFSATSKHVETATTPTVASETPTRQVEEIQVAEKVTEESQNQSQSETAQVLSQTVKELNEQMYLLDTNISFGFNDEINKMYVTVIENSTGEMIRKIPTEEAMALSAKMKEIVGMIFDKKG
ncbi:flagellar protein FlaG [Sulfurospirillum halorespirans]|uniref:Flagellar protein FlaG n=1 Tax=Sulfurospirillum halorespirans DSM 13726 TaxID=1193502 RepID=A0A1D7TJD6_9BACT|nr:flagellar protein FlaG [Sulfurospirillum halorespirans]AOO65138.1 flagellar protein FlaG [Sulfurospirillum halorespirans DSM 13726]